MANQMRFGLHLKETHDGYSGGIFVCDPSEPDGLSFDAVMNMATAKAALREYGADRTQRNLKNAIKFLEHLVSLMPDTHSHKYRWCYTLATLYKDLHVAKRDLVYLDKTISFCRMSLDMAPNDYPGRAVHLIQMGIVYLERGDLTDAEDSAKFLRQAIDGFPDGSEPPYSWHFLGFALFNCYRNSGTIVDLDKSIIASRQAVKKCTSDDANRPICLTLLGLSICIRVRLTGTWQNAEGLDLILCEDAIRTANNGSGTFVVVDLLLERFRHSGQPAEVDKAVSIMATLRDALDKPEQYSRSRSTLPFLSHALQERFVRFRDPRDLDQLLSVMHEIVRSERLRNSQDLPDFISNLGLAYFNRFEFTKNSSDIDEAIAVTRQAVDATPDGHWSKHFRWGDLGSLLQERYSSFGRIEDLEEGHICHERGLHDLPDDSHYRPKLLRFLGWSYAHRYKAFNQAEDIDKAIEAHQAVVNATPEDHLARASRMFDLGYSFRTRFGISGDPSDMDEAASVFKAATFCKGSLSIRMQSAWHWGEAAFWQGSDQIKAAARRTETDDDVLDRSQASTPVDPNSIEEPYQAFSRMMDLVPPTVWLGDTITVRHDVLKRVSGLVRSAAGLVSFRYRRSATAVEWLEQGRSMVWRQQLNLRTPLDEIHDVAPTLAARMRAVSGSLDNINMSIDHSNWRAEELPVDDIGPTRRRLAEEWDGLLLEARRIPGFERLLQPRQLPELQEAARIGPIVVLNEGATCHAFAILEGRDDVLRIPLGVSVPQVDQLRGDLGEMLTSSNVRSRLALEKRNRHQPDNQEMQRILLSLWIEVVKPVLDALEFLVLAGSESHPRIVWCPTGSLAFLPIHAAGDYSREEPGHRISDYVVSSYTTTISALLDASHRPATSEFRCLTVSQRDTPGLTSLPCTELEIQKVKQRFEHKQVEELAGEAATVAAVHEAMERCSWIHLACHAIQDSTNPLKSAFCLANGRLELQDIIRKTHPHADFAFLSACQTSTGDHNLADEAVHLAAGMQLAGYRSIVATMWSIGDEDGPLVADEVYAHLLRDGKPDSSRAAHALHQAVLKLQETTKPDDRDDSWFLRWVPFIHIGA